MLASFTRHPKSVGETYGEHMGVAWSFGFTLLGAAWPASSTASCRSPSSAPAARRSAA
jgi:hypothetical protein